MDDPVDTDRLDILVPEDPDTEAEVPGEEFDAADYGDGWSGWVDTEPDVPDEDRFDAFNASTWHFKAPPTPWYRTKQALVAMVAVGVAVVAIVVSAVLLAFRGPSDTTDQAPATQAPATQTSSTPTTVASTPEPTSELPPPPPPPPPPPLPPPESAAAPPAPPPAYDRPRSEPRPTRGPEIGVTRTPITRAPISVAPQPRSGLQHR